MITLSLNGILTCTIHILMTYITTICHLTYAYCNCQWNRSSRILLGYVMKTKGLCGVLSVCQSQGQGPLSMRHSLDEHGTHTHTQKGAHTHKRGWNESPFTSLMKSFGPLNSSWEIGSCGIRCWYVKGKVLVCKLEWSDWYRLRVTPDKCLIVIISVCSSKSILQALCRRKISVLQCRFSSQKGRFLVKKLWRSAYRFSTWKLRHAVSLFLQPWGQYYCLVPWSDIYIYFRLFCIDNQI